MKSATFMLVIALTGCTMGLVEDDNGNGAVYEDGDKEAEASEAVQRARLWVEAKVPYCQVANNQPDGGTCAATCVRPANPEWDPYKSDDGGLISWAWALPAPGRAVSGFAPNAIDISSVIMAKDLKAGDIVTSPTHVMLFKKWVTRNTRAVFMEESSCVSPEPYAREFTANVVVNAELIEVDGGVTYTAGRRLVR